MIISPPFILPVVKKDEKYTTKKSLNDPVIVTPTDDEITEAAMRPTASSLIGGTGIEEGTFPVSNHLMWHNGIHLQARDAGSHDYPIHAIADGEVVFMHKPNPMRTNDLAGQYYDESWTDNGCIVLKHKTEIGADGDQPVSITYYSVYMHLVRILITGGVGRKVYRKDKLGVAGQIYGHTKQLHFEICCDTENLKKIIGRDPGWQGPEAIPTKDGRTDSIFGSLYIYLPATTPIRIDPPTDHLRADSTTTLGTAQWIKLDYGSEGRMPGTCALTSYSTSGQLGATRQDINAEYNLYKEATDRHNSLIKAHPTVKSSPSGWYELLRFGRNIGRSTTDKDPLPDDAAHWRKIRTLEGKVVWADLNAPGTYKFSDADFLPQFGWNCYDDDTNPNDQRCDSERIKALIRAEGDQPNPDRNKDDVNLSRRLGDKDVRKAMRRAICKFPCEWDKHAMVKRYEWLKEVEYGYKDNPEGWIEYVNHLRAMTFDGLPQEYTDAQWRFHPTEFIKHFRKCGWLSKEEIAQLVPSYAIRTAINKQTRNKEILWEKVRTDTTDDSQIFKYHLTPLNRAMRKYGINTPMRQACFFGNAVQETNWMQSLPETGGRGLWYAPWYGRGFLQLTNPGNYCDYWAWRGRKIKPGLRDELMKVYNAIYRLPPNQRRNTDLEDEKFTGITQEIKVWRNDVEALTKPHAPPEQEALLAPSDSAGFYWIARGMGKHADAPHVLEARVVESNLGRKTYYRSPAFWKASAAVNSPLAVSRIDYSGLNGFDSRCCAYGVAVAVLSELLLPDGNGQPTVMYPTDFEPRR
ncbi:hypothetical protein FHW67_002999 [Herbaspirillum sp. Sphag1AN]|uniref:M23 family metallopeptidase n=1 Tax=unclassified Herbaspirillum TaxID=2624150 RepID=UPI00160E8CA7|nr:MULTISPECIES: M23 family metallopeptidase [unclassified Herbaspirillum]MBB3213698.1 hypothetical protein [Herbaspirillum sp. Sphag1AN]MBB3246895.1 hypothetical protein [Herbaspirillum sp. Sphag64]